jgi:CheY-like chemotaxis protein
MRTPLAGTIALLESALAVSGLPAAAARDTGAALTAARDIERFLGDLVAMPEGGKAPLAAQPFRVDEVMESVVTLLAAPAAAQGLRLATAVAAGTPATWRGDAARLRQMLVTLVGTSLRFTDRGEVRLEARETATGALELRISDTGRGFAPDRLERLFEPLGWAEGGVGLGLSLCRELAQRMGGGITARSALGQGSAFTVTLPLARAEAGEAAVATPVAAPPVMPGPAVLALAPVLVVDDVAANRLLLGAVLARAGFAHEQAESGEAALAMVAARPFAAVLMDLQMPGMDGLEATRRLRALPGAAGRLTVVGVTADRTPAIEAEARQAGMDACLAKPVSAADLVRLLGTGAPG